MASSYGSDASKSSLRQNYLTLCQSMPKEFSSRIDVSVRGMLSFLDFYRDADLILGYLPMHEEIDTLPLLEKAMKEGKRVALPLFDAKEIKLYFYVIHSLSEITRGSRGLARPPRPSAIPLEEKDFFGSACFVPGLVFDGEGYRVGYGAGYYDEFLAFYPGHKIGITRSVQVSSNPLPHNDHDVPVDVLVTEGSIWRCRKIMETAHEMPVGAVQ